MYKTNPEPDAARVTVSEARRTFADLMNRVAYGNERITVVRHGRAVAAIVPMADVAPRSAPPAPPAPNRRGSGPRP